MSFTLTFFFCFMRFALKQYLFVYAKRQTIIALHLKHYLFLKVQNSLLCCKAASLLQDTLALLGMTIWEGPAILERSARALPLSFGTTHAHTYVYIICVIPIRPPPHEIYAFCSQTVHFFVPAKRQTIIALHLKHYLSPPVIPTDSDEGARLERICDRPKGND